MKQRAFTLMELMIVIVIIGILSAVGMVMFGGQAEKAKIAVIKTNFKMVKKYVSVELMKCQIGDTDIFINSGKYKVSCSAVHDAHRTSAAMVFDPSLRFLNPIDNGVWNREDQLAVRNDVYKGSSIPDNEMGYIFLNFKSTWPASMRSCFEAPCSSNDNVLTATLNY